MTDNNLVVTAAASTIKSSDLYMTIVATLFTSPSANLNGVRCTEQFIDDIVANQDDFVGLPLYADVKSLERGKTNDLGHMYDSETDTFGSTQIGSFYKYEKTMNEKGEVALIGYARVMKRNTKIRDAIMNLFAENKLKFSFEISVGSYTENDDGTITIDKADKNFLEGMAIVSNPACPDAVAMDLVAEVKEEEVSEMQNEELVVAAEVETANNQEESLVVEAQLENPKPAIRDEIPDEEKKETAAKSKTEEVDCDDTAECKNCGEEENAQCKVCEEETAMCKDNMSECKVCEEENAQCKVCEDETAQCKVCEEEDAECKKAEEETAGCFKCKSELYDPECEDCKNCKDTASCKRASCKKTAEALIEELLASISDLKKELAETKALVETQTHEIAEIKTAKKEVVLDQVNPFMAEINTNTSNGFSLLGEETREYTSFSLLD